MAVPHLPSLSYLPISMAGDCVFGFAFGKLTGVNAAMTTTIFLIRGIAHSIVYLLANSVFRGEGLTSHKIYIGTTLVVNLIFLVVLREFDLISKFFLNLFGSILLAYVIRHVYYIEKPRTKDKDLLEPI